MSYFKLSEDTEITVTFLIQLAFDLYNTRGLENQYSAVWAVEEAATIISEERGIKLRTARKHAERILEERRFDMGAKRLLG